MNRFTRWMRRLVGRDDETSNKIQQIRDELAKCRKSQEATLEILNRRSLSREPVPVNFTGLDGPMLGMSVQEVRDLLARHGLALRVVEAPKP